MIRHTFALPALAACLWISASPAADTPPLCANAEQAAKVREFYAAPAAAAPFQAAPKIGLPEAVVLSALPADKAVGTPGSAFVEVWKSLQEWDRALTLVLKGGHVFEIFGKVQPGAPSKTSQYYNIEYPAAGLGGHLRPDLIAAIYVVSLQTREGPLRGVSFVDAKGDNAFNVFLLENQKPTAAEVAQFARTRALVAGLPRVCPPLP